MNKDFIYEEQKQLIEMWKNKYYEQKEKLEQLEEEIAEYEFLIKMQNNREYRSKFLKEFQKEHGKNVFPDYDEIYKRYDRLKEENKQLENNRHKALEYIEKHNFMSDWGSCIFGEANLYDIIKGDSDDQR